MIDARLIFGYRSSIFEFFASVTSLSFAPRTENL